MKLSTEVFTKKIETLLKHYPRLRSYIRKSRHALWRLRIYLQASVRTVSIDPLRVLWVPPSTIKNVGIDWWKGLGRYKKEYEFGKVVGGDWDLSVMPFEDLDVYRAFSAHVVHGARWEDTGYYKTLATQISQGLAPYGLRDRQALDERLKRLECVMSDMKQNGYRSKASAHDGYSRQAVDEITVRLGRNGHLLFEDGRHRLTMAKLLDLPRIPVMVTWRHAAWVQFRAEIIDYARAYGGKVYSPLTHPDLCDIPSHHSDARFDLIRGRLPFLTGTVLDIGANWGYFCHKFEQEGFRCYAVEENPTNFYFLDRLRIAEQRIFIPIHANIFEFWDKSEFDVVLALNIFHHLIKTEEDYYQLTRFLRRIKTRVLFFEPHTPNDPQMQGAYRNFSPEQFVQFVAENMELSRYEQVGHDDDDRPIYMLTGY